MKTTANLRMPSIIETKIDARDEIMHDFVFK
jgi:hypothetical protein